MLRIGLIDNSQSPTIKLEGNLSGPWVDELEQAWSKLTDKTPAQTVVIDLSGVNFIGAEGKRILGWMFRQGAELRNGPLMTRYIVDQIVRGESDSRGNGG